MVSERATLALTDDALSTTVEDEEVILDAEAGVYYGLNPVGTRVWELLEDPRTLREVVDRIHEEYDVSREKCADDVHSFVDDLLDAGLVEVREAGDEG